MSKTISLPSPRNWSFVTIAALLVILAGVTLWALNERSHANNLRQVNASNTQTGPSHSIETALDEHGIVPLNTEEASNNKTTADELAYLIEEEKLAHDVYQAMYEKWGVRIFNNIQSSETMHQSMVLAVMQSRDLSDPRKSEVGQFTNQDLQALYDRLIAQGNQSVAEAYKAGVIVEETDIADLKKTLEALDAKDTDVKDVLENLLHASENHLRAFSRQLAR
jgi:hypothetical protein